MKIPIDRNKRIILLKWLDRGIINTDDLPIEDDEKEKEPERLESLRK